MDKKYAWVVLACLFLIYMASNGMVLNTFTMYTPKLKEFWNLTQGEAASFQSTIYLILALPLPIVGFLLQKYSVKKLMIIGSIGVVASLFIFANTSTVATLRIFTIVFPLFLSITGLLSCMYLINTWFNKYKGIATGILLTASSLGPAIFAPILGKWMATLGWQKAAFYEAIICGLMILIPVLFIKNKPASYIVENNNADKNLIKKHLQSAFMSPKFYLLIVVTAALWFCVGGLFVHHGLYLKSLQLDTKSSGKIISIFFICGLSGKLFFGFISDYSDVKKIMLISVANMLLGCGLLYLSINNSSYMIPYAIVLGFGYSGTFTMIQLYVIKLFGGPAYGIILGILSFVDTLALAFGGAILAKMSSPKIIGENVNYSSSFQLMIILTGLSLLATLIINNMKSHSDKVVTS